MLNKNMRQQGGNHSTNVQGETVHFHNGITLADAKEIANDVFEKNMYKLTSIAETTAKERADFLVSKMLSKIDQEAEKEKLIGKFSDPDIQYILYTSQKSFARNGDQDLGEVLSNLFIERLKSGEDDFKKLIMNEAIEIVPRLTNKQIEVLTLNYTMIQMKINGISSLEDYRKMFYKIINPFIPSELPAANDCVHLDFCRVAKLDMGYRTSVSDITRIAYPEIFPQVLSEAETLTYITKSIPEFLDLHNIWNKSMIQKIYPTLVGWVLAQLAIEKRTGIKLNIEF
ncbi:LPO_1073/Vpar_1526 family protein [Bacillus atrophaeus]|uniref:LPO_1073/Vpar_1526 family protein n=1 Tax=Bacillus atrophaeus TaxID=1452 RepID=UPI003D1D9B55